MPVVPLRAPSTRALYLAGFAVAVASIAVAAYVAGARSSDRAAGTGEPTAATRDGLAALVRMNGQPCAAVLTVNRISADDYNLECAVGADGARRAMYLANLKTGRVR